MITSEKHDLLEAAKQAAGSRRQLAQAVEICSDFREMGSLLLSWNMAQSRVSLWSLDGRLDLPFVCGMRQRELLAFQRGETDLVYRDREWYLFTTVDIPDAEERQALDWIDVDLGIVNIATTSDGTTFAGAKTNGHRRRDVRLRRKLQKKGTEAARRLLRRRRQRTALCHRR
jgi:putative transposase